jgi:hypothetical protein
MPANMSWSQLAVLDASNNDFSGPLADALYSLPVLGYLNLANNRCGRSTCTCNICVCADIRRPACQADVATSGLS